MKNLYKYKNYIKLFGIILFLYILSRQDIKKVYSIILNSNIKLLILSLLILPLALFIRTIRFKSILSLHSNNFPVLKNLYKIYIESFFWGIITPGRVGELSRIFYITKFTANKMQAIFIVIVDRIIDVLLLFEIALLSLLYFSSVTGYLSIGETLVYSIVSIIIFLLIPLLIFNKNIISIFFYISKLISSKINIKLQFVLDEIEKFNLNKIQNWHIITVIAWLIYFFQIYLISLSLDLKLSYFYTVIIVSISSMVALLPVTILGIGTRDITIISLLKQLGIAQEIGFTFSFMILFITYINSLLCLLFINIFEKKDRYIEK